MHTVVGKIQEPHISDGQPQPRQLVMPKWIILNKGSNNHRIFLHYNQLLSWCALQCFSGKCYKVKLPSLSRFKEGWIGPISPPPMLYLILPERPMKSVSVVGKAGFPFSFRVALDLEQQESVPLLLGFRIFFKHILNPVLCFSYFLPVRDKGDPIVLLWYYARSSLCSCHRGI